MKLYQLDRHYEICKIKNEEFYHAALRDLDIIKKMKEVDPEMYIRHYCEYMKMLSTILRYNDKEEINVMMPYHNEEEGKLLFLIFPYERDSSVPHDVQFDEEIKKFYIEVEVDSLHDAINDCFVNVNGSQPSDNSIQEIRQGLSDDVNAAISLWGASDTVTKDMICDHIIAINDNKMEE